MSSAFECIKKGLDEALVWSQGKPVEVRTIGTGFETSLL